MPIVETEIPDIGELDTHHRMLTERNARLEQKLRNYHTRLVKAVLLIEQILKDLEEDVYDRTWDDSGG